jgi:signal transduction histidine kinase
LLTSSSLRQKKQQHLVLGFFGVLAVLLGLAIAVLLRMSHINTEIRDTIAVQSKKASLVATMRDAMRERQVGLRDMVILADPFEKDQAWQYFTFAASRFLQARNRLLETALSSEEYLALDNLTVLATEGQEIQYQVVNLARSGAPPETTASLLQQAIRAQNRAMVEMARLIDIQQTSADTALETSKQDFNQAVWLMLGLGSLAVALALLILMLVLRRDRTLSRELETYQNHLEELVSERTRELETAVEELKTFSYSLAHDLRQPLRGLDGFSLLLVEDYNDVLDDTARDYLYRIRAGSQLMGKLLDGMLRLTRLSRHELVRQPVDLSNICKQIVEQSQYQDSNRKVEWIIEDGIKVHADESLMRIVLENLLSNSWKFTRDTSQPRIEFGSYRSDTGIVYYVKDNGAGFDMAYADKLFSNFGRLHSVNEFEGTGIGLATVDRIIKRHGGEIWAKSEPGQGAGFFFTLA